MPKSYILFLVLLISGLSCKKDKDSFFTGRVNIKGGCFDDSWLIAIDNPDPSIHPFLRSTSFASGTLYNCSNAVFIQLPSPLAVAGTRIRFAYIATEGSCLSFSEAPNHIKVKKLSRF